MNLEPTRLVTQNVADFEVTGVGAEHERLRESIIDWVLLPTDQPWRNRTTLFRDPQGDLVKCFPFLARQQALRPHGARTV